MEGRGRQISEFEASLVYKRKSRTARAIQRNPGLKIENTNKNKNKNKNKIKINKNQNQNQKTKTNKQTKKTDIRLWGTVLIISWCRNTHPEYSWHNFLFGLWTLLWMKKVAKSQEHARIYSFLNPSECRHVTICLGNFHYMKSDKLQIPIKSQIKPFSLRWFV